MAELAVSGALVLVEIVVPLLTKLSFHGDLKAGIISMKSWLNSMKALLEGVSGIEGTKWIENQVDQVRDIAYDIEDVLEEFVLHSLPLTSHNHRFTWNLHNSVRDAYHGFPLRGISKKIAIIKTSIADIESQQKAFGNLSSHLRPSSSSRIRNALLPPYYMDLSRNLKSCFLYFGIFPENDSVECGRLIRLWVAEQFAVGGRDSEAHEDVAEGHLNELIQRNLIHVSERDFDGRPRKCRAVKHFNFITQKCKDENFASIFPRESTSQNHKIRRLSVHNDYNHLPQNSDFSGVRSMFLLGLPDISTPNFKKVLRDLEVVRVIDFQGAPITEFPEDITHHTLLRHLNLRGTKINTIPSSIEKLSYLETLDLKQTDVTELPKEISHLHNLRHLFAYKHNVENYVFFESVQGVKIYEGIGKLKNLQKLSLVNVGKKVRILDELKTLTKLRKLGVTRLKKGHGKWLSASLEHMPHLRTLDLCSNTKEEFLELGNMINPPLALQRLYLKGRLIQFPSWNSSLNNLLRIGLKWSKLSNSPLEALWQLPNLMELELVDCYTGEELIFEASSFKKLEILLIEDFSQLHTIKICSGAMPDVKQISLRRCPRVMIFPLGMNNLTKVKELTLYDMAHEFIARLRKNGEDCAMVTHIPEIRSFTLTNRSWSPEKIN